MHVCACVLLLLRISWYILLSLLLYQSQNVALFLFCCVIVIDVVVALTECRLSICSRYSVFLGDSQESVRVAKRQNYTHSHTNTPKHYTCATHMRKHFMYFRHPNLNICDDLRLFHIYCHHKRLISTFLFLCVWFNIVLKSFWFSSGKISYSYVLIPYLNAPFCFLKIAHVTLFLISTRIFFICFALLTHPSEYKQTQALDNYAKCVSQHWHEAEHSSECTAIKRMITASVFWSI